MILFMVIVFFVTMFLGAPMVLCIAGSSIFALDLFGTISSASVASKVFTALDSFTLVALPCFLLAGNVMQGGIADKLIDFCDAFLGRTKGSVGTVAVLACMIFAAISGSGPAAVAAMGMCLLPVMEKRGYDMGYASSLVATAGGLGIIIPPSLPMISYCLMAECSVGAMFMCGVFPGLLFGLAFMIVNWIVSGVKGYGASRDRRLTLKEFFSVMKNSIPAILMPVIILGGIYGGFFTASEAACVAVVYGLLVGMFFYKSIKPKELLDMLYNACKMSGAMLLVFATAQSFVYVLTIKKVPTKLTTFVTSSITSPFAFVWAILIVLLVLGCFMEVKTAITILTPLLVPICKAYGFSVMQMGLLMICTLNIGGITPPYGFQMFITSGISGVSISKMFKWLILFVIINLIVLVPLVFFPQITLWLPTRLGMPVE